MSWYIAVREIESSVAASDTFKSIWAGLSPTDLSRSGVRVTKRGIGESTVSSA
jgi:hypothetical protein